MHCVFLHVITIIAIYTHLNFHLYTYLLICHAIFFRRELKVFRLNNLEEAIRPEEGKYWRK